MALVDTLGGKAPGQLIRSEDWNALVTAIDGIDARLTELATSTGTRLDALEGRADALESGLSAVGDQVTAVSARVDGLASGLEALQAQVEPIARALSRVTMQTSRVFYAIGELAELTAQVTDLAGEPIAFADGDRPWIDFVAPWGRLRPVAGFESRGGAGDRTISVRADQQGRARVLLRAEVATMLSEAVEDDLAGALTATVPDRPEARTVAETILAAPTPADARSAGAFRLLSREYDRDATSPVRAFIDTHYLGRLPEAPRFLGPHFHSLWRDRRATVLAFAKGDADPRTPEPSRGVASIQVTFRDWIGPWLHLDYLTPPEIERHVPDIRDRLRPKVTRDFAESMIRVRDEVKDIVRERGVVGKLRDYRVVDAALDGMSVANAPDFLPELTTSLQRAVSLQAAIEQSEVLSAPPSAEPAALSAFTDSAVRTDQATASVRGTVSSLAEQVGAVEKGAEALRGEVRGARQDIGAIGGRVDATLATGGELQQIRAGLTTVSQQVQAFSALNVDEVAREINELQGLKNRVSRIEAVR